MYVLKADGITDIGKVRKNNQDSFAVKIGRYKNSQIGFFCVADGMGGLEDGEFASRTVIDEISIWWNKKLKDFLENKFSDEDIFAEMDYIINSSNFKIREYSAQNSKKVGTTCSMMFLYKNKYYISHIGDSRIYSIRNKRLQLLTYDETWVNLQVKLGTLTEAEALNHPKRNVLTNCVGIKENIKSIKCKGDYKKGDIFFLCSDGFYNIVNEKNILDLFLEPINISNRMNNAIKFAKETVARDNITLILIEVT